MFDSNVCLTGVGSGHQLRSCTSAVPEGCKRRANVKLCRWRAVAQHVHIHSHSLAHTCTTTINKNKNVHIEKRSNYLFM